MFEVLLILVVVSMSTSLLGGILVLKNQTMMTDALSHSVLLGIVLGFFISHSLESPLLVVGAALFGVLTVLLIEKIRSERLAQDAATGLVFSTFFALAVLLITMFARDVHLDMDMVLMGEVIFAPFYRVSLFGMTLPIALVKVTVVGVVILIFWGLFYQPLKVMLFDQTQAQLQGVPVSFLRLLIMVLASLTTVVSFDAIGTVAVIVFMICPGMTALIWSQKLPQFLASTFLMALINSCLGLVIAKHFDLTVTGSCAVVSLGGFVLLLLGQDLIGYLKRKTL